MSDTNATVTTQENAEMQTRTFTQEEVNSFLANDRRKMQERYADYDVLKAKAEKFDEAEEAAKTELQKATERANTLEAELTALKKADEVRTMRENVANETGIPVHLLTGATEDECKAQAEAIKAYAQPSGYPKVKDGGEMPKPNGSTKQQFADFMGQILN